MKKLNNLQSYDFPEYNLILETEIQSVKIRAFQRDTKQPIAVASIEAALIGQCIPKGLYVDTSKREEFTKNIHKALRKVGQSLGFVERMHQRKKPNGFVTLKKEA